MPAYLEPWVFIQTPKSGSQSITCALEDIAMQKKLNVNVKLWGNKYNHASLNQMLNFGAMSSNLPKNFKSFGVVRNPYARAVSIFKHFTKNDKLSKFFGPSWEKIALSQDLLTFNGFWKNMRIAWLDKISTYNPDYKYLFISCPQYIWVEGCDVVLKLEDQLKINNFLQTEFNCEISKLPHVNSSIIPSNRDYKNYYNDESYEMITNLFKKDIESFNYTF